MSERRIGSLHALYAKPSPIAGLQLETLSVRREIARAATCCCGAQPFRKWHGVDFALQREEHEQQHWRNNLAGDRLPNSGDLLVSRRSARADAYEISVVSEPAYITARSYREAIEKAKALAGSRSVDAWFTCDHRHYANIARHRVAEPHASMP